MSKPRFTATAGGNGRVGNDLVGEGFGAGKKFGGGHHLIHQADSEGFIGLYHVAGEKNLQGAAFADKARQALRAAIAGDDSELDFRLTEVGILRGNSHRTGQSQFAAAAESKAIYGGDDGLAAVFNQGKQGLAALGKRLCFNRAEPCKIIDVGAGDERFLAIAGEDRDPHLNVIADGLKGTSELLHGLDVERVEYLRAGNGYECNLISFFVPKVFKGQKRSHDGASLSDPRV
jgi:hypothetical protein